MSEHSFPSRENLLTMLSVIHNPHGILKNPSLIKENPLKLIFNNNASITNEKGQRIPIKVNCRMGADRTGLFCSLYAIERNWHKNMNNKEAKNLFKKAKKQLSFRYGHIKFLCPKMDKFIKKWWNIRKNNDLKTTIDLYTEET